MVVIRTEIEIAKPPEEVRKVFLDFPSYPQWSNRFIRSIEPTPTKPSLELEKGDTIHVVLEGMAIDPAIVQNSTTVFEWRGSAFGVFVGNHSFRFEASKSNAGGTTFAQEENFQRAMAVLMMPVFGWDVKTKANFEKFNEDLKGRVEGG